MPLVLALLGAAHIGEYAGSRELTHEIDDVLDLALLLSGSSRAWSPRRGGGSGLRHMVDHSHDADPLASTWQVIFWILFALSRLVLAPCICKCLSPRPASMVMAGAALSAACCFPVLLCPDLWSILLGVAGVALGAGPSYAMIISMAKERRPGGLTSIDTAMFSIASSLGAGGVPFLMSRVLSLFGTQAFFPTLSLMSFVLLAFTFLLNRLSPPTELTEPDEESTEASTAMEQPVPGIVWTYWEQGWEHAPSLCQACVKSWRLANPELHFQQISSVDLPELLPELCGWKRFWELPAAQRADVLRLALLEKFGGLWVDATLFCSAPVMPWLQALKEGGSGSEQEGFFFVFDRSQSKSWPCDPFVDCELWISNWFIASSPGHPLTSNWLAALRLEFCKAEVDYFCAHHSFRQMVQASPEAMKLYQEVPKVSARHPHLLEFELGFGGRETEAGAERLRQALQAAPVQKLSHKILQPCFLTDLMHQSTMLKCLFSLHGAAIGDSFLRSFRCKQRSNADLILEELERRKKVRSSWQLSIHVPTK
ncbi:unnamed protein product [Durusdinium trenchii]|uniref:Uncharacterized protein n=1 Tax=Durusdinium trenchii TaxID=1381693 RepID=A0ABP0NME4_9DINO